MCGETVKLATILDQYKKNTMQRLKLGIRN
jgi:hypothetical protein